MPGKNGIEIRKDVLKLSTNEMKMLEDFYERKMNIIGEEMKKLFVLYHENFKVG